MLGIKVAITHDTGQVPGYLNFSFHEGSTDDEPRGFVRKLACAPSFDLPTHWFEVPLHAVHSDQEDTYEADVFRVLRQHRRERARDNVAKLGV